MPQATTVVTETASRKPADSPFWSGEGFSVWMGWQLLAAIGVALAAHLVQMAVPVWSLSSDVQRFLVLVAIAHVSAAFGVSWRVLQRGRVSVPGVVLADSVAYGVLFVLLRLSNAYLSRSVLIISFALSVVFLSVSLRWIRLLLPVILIAVGGLVTMAWGEMPDGRVVSTTLYPLRPVVHRGAVPSDVTGGSIKAFAGGFLVVAGDGGMFYLEERRSESALISRRLSHRVPLNLEAFRTAVPVRTRTQDFRAADMLTFESDGQLRLIASHQYWNGDGKCIVIRLSSAETPLATFLDGQTALKWETVYETKPCLPINEQTNLGEMGGRLLRLDDQTVLMTVGDVGFNGVGPDKRTLAQDSQSSYGKTIRIDLKSRTVTTYTTGHRNPQGLYRTPDGLIWETEHGPKGGDELNLVEQGRDYGWPLVTYGANYNDYVWPLSSEPGRHAGHTSPIFAWLPSIGVSNLISIEGNLFNRWKGDLLVASLRGQSLFRLRVRDGAVVFSEPIAVGRRVRDLVEAPDGRIVLLQDFGAVTFLEPTAPPPIWNVNRCEPPFLC